MSDLTELTCRQLDTEIALLQEEMPFLLRPAVYGMMWSERGHWQLVSTTPDIIGEHSFRWVPRYAYTQDIAAALPLLEEMQTEGEVTEILMAATGITGCTSLVNLQGVLENLSPVFIARAWYEWRTGRRVTITEQENTDVES